MKPKEALREAATTFHNPPSEPQVPNTHIRLRHLGHSLELVTGKDDEEAMRALLSALQAGRISAVVKQADGGFSSIPADTWSQINSDSDGWFWGVIHFDTDLPNYKGCLPLVEQKLAESWLVLYSPSAGPGRPRKSEKAKIAYCRIYPSGHDVEGHSWKEAARKVSQEIGETVTKDTIRRGLGLKK